MPHLIELKRADILKDKALEAVNFAWKHVDEEHGGTRSRERFMLQEAIYAAIEQLRLCPHVALACTFAVFKKLLNEQQLNEVRLSAADKYVEGIKTYLSTLQGTSNGSSGSQA